MSELPSEQASKRVIKEGWWSAHPTSGQRVAVVPEAYAEQLEADLEQMRQERDEANKKLAESNSLLEIAQDGRTFSDCQRLRVEGELAEATARAERAEARELKLHNENEVRRARINQLETNAIFAEMKHASDLRERIEIDERRKTAETELATAQLFAVDGWSTAMEWRVKAAWLEHWRDFFKARAFRLLNEKHASEAREKALREAMLAVIGSLWVIEAKASMVVRRFNDPGLNAVECCKKILEHRQQVHGVLIAALKKADAPTETELDEVWEKIEANPPTTEQWREMMTKAIAEDSNDVLPEDPLISILGGFEGFSGETQAAMFDDFEKVAKSRDLRALQDAISNWLATGEFESSGWSAIRGVLAGDALAEAATGEGEA